MQTRLENSEAIVVRENECFQRVVRPNIWVQEAEDRTFRYLATCEVTRHLAHGVNQLFTASEVLPPGLEPLLVLAGHLSALLAFLRDERLHVWKDCLLDVVERCIVPPGVKETHLLKINDPALRCAVSQHLRANHERMD